MSDEFKALTMFLVMEVLSAFDWDYMIGQLRVPFRKLVCIDDGSNDGVIVGFRLGLNE